MNQLAFLPRVLIVDDYPALASMIRDVLATDYTCEVVTSAEGALSLLRTGHRFDLMITDVEMAGMDGIALLTIAREISPNLPVIVMSATSNIEVTLAALRAGAAAYLSKPFDIADLRETVTRTLTNSQSTGGSSVNKGGTRSQLSFRGGGRLKRSNAPEST